MRGVLLVKVCKNGNCPVRGVVPLIDEGFDRCPNCGAKYKSQEPGAKCQDKINSTLHAPRSTLVEVKSTPENYEKEYYGDKNNTARFFESDDPRLPILRAASTCTLNQQLKIRVRNTETLSYFEREVRDVTFYKHPDAPELTIITWIHNNDGQVDVHEEGEQR